MLPRILYKRWDKQSIKRLIISKGEKHLNLLKTISHHNVEMVLIKYLSSIVVPDMSYISFANCGTLCFYEKEM